MNERKEIAIKVEGKLFKDLSELHKWQPLPFGKLPADIAEPEKCDYFQG